MGVQVRQKGGEGAWWVFVSQGKRRTSHKVGDKRAAENLAKDLREALARGKFSLDEVEAQPEPSAPTFSTYAEHYLRDAEFTLKRSTWKDYEGSVARFLKPAFGPRQLGEITRADVKALAYDLRRNEGLSPKTVRKVIGTLSVILNEAMDDNLIASNPALGLRKVYRSAEFKEGESDKSASPLTREELSHLLSTALHHAVKRGGKIKYPYRRYYPFLLLLARTGVRLGEAIGLKLGDIDWIGSFIEVRRAVVRGQVTSTKNKKTRRVDMSDQLRETLRSLYEERFGSVVGITTDAQVDVDARRAEALDQWVFTNGEGDNLDPDNFRQRVFGPLLEAAKLRKVRIHDLRHTYASLLIAAGKELHYVQQQLGHHSPAFTLSVYGHLLPRDRRGEVNCLDDAHKDTSSKTGRAA